MEISGALTHSSLAVKSGVKLERRRDHWDSGDVCLAQGSGVRVSVLFINHLSRSTIRFGVLASSGGKSCPDVVPEPALSAHRRSIKTIETLGIGV